MHTLAPTIARQDVAGLGPTEAARLLGISRSMLHRYEKGKRKPPADIVHRMLEVYGLTAQQGRALVAWWGER